VGSSNFGATFSVLVLLDKVGIGAEFFVVFDGVHEGGASVWHRLIYRTSGVDVGR